MIQISTFPAAPSTERVPSLAERVASLRYSINLQLLNNRVPGLVSTLQCLIFGTLRKSHMMMAPVEVKEDHD